MRDTSLLRELEQVRTRTNKRRKYLLLLALPLTLLAIASVSAMTTGDTASSNPSLDTKAADSSEPITPPATTESSNSTPEPQQPLTEPPKVVNTGLDYSEINATLCNDMVVTIKAQNKSYLSQYSDNQKYWIDLYRGSYDSQEAQESKQYYINYTKGRFSELISTASPSLQKVCSSSTSISEILLQPNYNAWN